MKPPINPDTFTPKLAALDARRAELGAEYESALAELAKFPDDSALDSKAAAIDAEIKSIEQQQARLIAARDQAAQKYAEGERIAFAAQLLVDTQKADALVTQMADQAAGIAKVIGKLGPMIDQLLELEAQRSALAWGVTRATGKRSDLEFAGILGGLVEEALLDAGIGRLVAVPRQLSPVRPGALDRLRSQQGELLYGSVKAAAASMEVPNPTPPVERLEPIALVAVERGSFSGRTIEPGQRINFDSTPSYPGGLPKPIPRWARTPDEAARILKARKEMRQDTKPVAAQQAAESKGEATRRALHR